MLELLDVSVVLSILRPRPQPHVVVFPFFSDGYATSSSRPHVHLHNHDHWLLGSLRPCAITVSWPYVFPTLLLCVLALNMLSSKISLGFGIVDKAGAPLCYTHTLRRSKVPYYTLPTMSSPPYTTLHAGGLHYIRSG